MISETSEWKKTQQTSRAEADWERFSARCITCKEHLQINKKKRQTIEKLEKQTNRPLTHGKNEHF